MQRSGCRPPFPRPLRWALLAVAAGACRGTPTQEETRARGELRTVESRYRPGGSLPELPPLAAGSSPEAFMRYGVLRSPRVEETFHLWAQAIEEITLARSLPDPGISLSAEVGSILEMLSLGLSAGVPARSKRELAAEAQSHRVRAARIAFERETLATASRVRTLYFEAAHLEQSIAISREILDVVREVENIASSRFRVAQVTLQDVLRVQIERDQVENDLASLEDARTTLRARFREALGIPSNGPDPPLPVEFPDAPLELPRGDVFREVLSRSPALRGLEEEILEAESLIALARRAGQPDLMIGAEINVLSPVFLTPEVGITLPIWRDKIEAGVAAATAFRKALGSRLEAAKLEAVMRLAEWLFLCRDAERRTTLLAGKLLPKAQQSLDVARSGYPTGKVDLTSLLGAQNDLLRFRLAQSRARMEREVAVSQVLLELLARPPAEELAPPGDAGKESGA